MQTRTIVMLAIAAILGLVLGYGLGTNTTESILWALGLGVVSVAGAYLALMRSGQAGAAPADTQTNVADPPFARFLFQDTRAAAIWLPIRIYIGWDWFHAGWGKLTSATGWMDNGNAILGFWKGSVAIPAAGAGSPKISYDWWRGFIQTLIDSHADAWFSKVIVFGELAVGLALILGALVGIAAAGGILMNMAYLLTGATSSNPVLLALSILLILAWKVAGWIGVDRWLLPLLGTPWYRGAMFKRDAAVTPARS